MVCFLERKGSRAGLGRGERENEAEREQTKKKFGREGLRD